MPSGETRNSVTVLPLRWVCSSWPSRLTLLSTISVSSTRSQKRTRSPSALNWGLNPDVGDQAGQASRRLPVKSRYRGPGSTDHRGESRIAAGDLAVDDVRCRRGR